MEELLMNKKNILKASHTGVPEHMYRVWFQASAAV
jgi:hypothetical protein